MELYFKLKVIEEIIGLVFVCGFILFWIVFGIWGGKR